MGSFTPKPKIKHINIKLTSNSEKYKLLTLKNVELPDIKNRYIKAMIKRIFYEELKVLRKQILTDAEAD